MLSVESYSVETSDKENSLYSLNLLSQEWLELFSIVG